MLLKIDNKLADWYGVDWDRDVPHSLRANTEQNAVRGGLS